VVGLAIVSVEDWLDDDGHIEFSKATALFLDPAPGELGPLPSNSRWAAARYVQRSGPVSFCSRCPLMKGR
jgi:hypothetical protein